MLKHAAIALALGVATSAQGALVLYYNFDGNTSDASGNGNHGAIIGNTSFTAPGGGKSGSALDQAAIFDGNGDGVSVTTAPAGALNSIAANNQVTVSLWTRALDNQQPRNQTNFSAFPAANGTGNRVLMSHIPWSDSNVYWDAGDTSNCCNSPQKRVFFASNDSEFAGNTWQHWAFVKDGVNDFSGIYLDGVLKVSTNASTDNISNMLSFFVGSEAGGVSSYLGQIDDFAVFNNALTQQQIAAIAAGAAIVLPEPSSALLLLAGAAGLLRRRRA